MCTEAEKFSIDNFSNCDQKALKMRKISVEMVQLMLKPLKIM